MRFRTTTMAGRLLLGALAVAAVGLAAGPATAAGTAAAGTQPQQVARVTANGVTVSFVSQPGPAGGPHIAVSAQGSLRGAASPVPALLAQRLTAQEIYLTLAGPGAVAPAALVAAQASEAASLGRAATVRTGVLPAAPAAPNSLANCQAHLMYAVGDSYHWANKGGGTYPGSPYEQSLFLGGVSGYDTTNLAGMGVCNESNSVTMQAKFSYNQRWNNLGWQDINSAALGPNGWLVYYYAWEWDSANVTYGASYEVRGTSTDSFDLLVAELVHSI